MTDLKPDLKPDDRVLILSLANREFLQELAATLAGGLLVGIGTPDDVYEARRALANADNVMFHPAEPEQIPWREAYFTVVIAPPTLSPQAEKEIRRVLVPEGRLHPLCKPGD